MADFRFGDSTFLLSSIVEDSIFISRLMIDQAPTGFFLKIFIQGVIIIIPSKISPTNTSKNQS